MKGSFCYFRNHPFSACHFYFNRASTPPYQSNPTTTVFHPTPGTYQNSPGSADCKLVRCPPVHHFHRYLPLPACVASCVCCLPLLFPSKHYPGLKCEPGMLSNPTFTACGPCLAGQYADTELQVCGDCGRGKYAPSAQENACLPCAAGSRTNNATAATQCTPCMAGRSSTNVDGDNAGEDGCKVPVGI